jgi:DNA repair exonuclease SbcCD ATPase subunit
VTETQTPPDLLDYAEQARALVSELQRLSSMRAALDDAAASLRSGQAEIQSATTTLTEHSNLALATYDDAQKYSTATLTVANERMNAAAELAERVAGVLIDLEQLHSAAKTLSNSRELLAGAATMLAAKGHIIDTGVEAISASSKEIDGAHKVLRTTHLEMHDAKGELTRVASNVNHAISKLEEQSQHTQAGVEKIQRCEANLASAALELTASRELLEAVRSQIEIEGATLATASVALQDRSLQLEQCTTLLINSDRRLHSAIQAIDESQQLLVRVAATVQDQVRLVDTAMERMIDDQSRISAMFSTLEQKHDQVQSAIQTLTSENRLRTIELGAALESVEQRLLTLQPIIEGVMAASTAHTQQVALQQRQLAQILASIRWAAIGLVASILVIVAMRALHLI